MGSLVRMCLLTVMGCMLVGAVVAWPSAEISARDARGQTITDSSDTPEEPRNVEHSEAYNGAVVPVALIYDNPKSEEIKRPLREVVAVEESITDEEKKGDDQKEELLNHDNKLKLEEGLANTEGKISRVGIKNSKLLNVEARENDENAKFGLEIQSRHNDPVDEVAGKFEKPFVYNIQPLSFYSSETKEEENILNYINKIKEMRENQIKFEAEKRKKNETAVVKHEDAIITEAESEDENGPIRRKIQHYETLIKPMAVDPQLYGAMPQTGFPIFPASSAPGTYQQIAYPQVYQHSTYPQVFQHNMYSQVYQHSTYPKVYPQSPYSEPNPQTVYPQSYQQLFSHDSYQKPPFSSVIYLPNVFQNHHTTKITKTKGSTRIFDEYFPILVNNPFNEIWAGITNIIEYGPQADVCRKNKKGREAEAEDENATEIDLSSQRLGFGGSKDDTWPKFTKLKVRKGGVAIAGPGGIATAGSGGTAIVGPGGTAYTTREGTAVVGPGGRVVHVPHFPVYAKNVDEVKPRDLADLPGSQTVADGPIVYYDNPLDTENIPDPSLPF